MTSERVERAKKWLRDREPYWFGQFCEWGITSKMVEMLDAYAEERASLLPQLGEAATEKAASELYHELIYAVGKKFRGETRHQTALRYIREAEQRSSIGCDSERAAKTEAVSS